MNSNNNDADSGASLSDAGLGDAADTSTDELEYALEAVNGPPEYKYAAMLGHARKLEEKLERIEVQAVSGVVDGWVCIPEVEWNAILSPNVELTGGASAPSSDRRERG